MSQPKTAVANKTISLLAKLLEGTQAPRSLGVMMLGAGTEPWDKLRDELHLHGWLNAEQIEEALRTRITEVEE